MQDIVQEQIEEREKEVPKEDYVSPMSHDVWKAKMNKLER